MRQRESTTDRIERMRACGDARRHKKGRVKPGNRRNHRWESMALAASADDELTEREKRDMYFEGE